MILPIRLFWNLHLPPRNKPGPAAVISLGLFAFACGVIKITFLLILNAEDITWAVADPVI
jgi:hypothetical protein